MEKFIFRLIIFMGCTFFYVASDSHTKICRVSPSRDMFKNAPMVLCGLANTDKYVYPLSIDPEYIVFNNGQKFTLFCGKSSGRKNTLKRLEKYNDRNVVKYRESTFISDMDKPVEAECSINDRVLINGHEVSINELKCDFQQIPRVYNGPAGCVKGSKREVSFDLNTNHELPILDLCYNDNNGRAWWVHTIIKPIYTKECNESPDDKFYSNIDSTLSTQTGTEKPYSTKTQEKMFKHLLGTRGREYIQKEINKLKYVSETELISHKHKFYGSEQNGIYFAPNTVPMWENIRRTVWNPLDDYIQKLAQSLRHELEIWTAGVGILKIKEKQIYLLGKSEASYKLPMPELIFKCVADRMAEKGACYLVGNKPRQEDKAITIDFKCAKDDSCYTTFDTTLSIHCCTIDTFHAAFNVELGLGDWSDIIAYKTFTVHDVDNFDYNSYIIEN